MLSIRIIPEAQCEFDAAIRWNERQHPGKGKRLASAVRKVLSEIVTSPDRWPLDRDDIRLAPVPRWFYAIHYRVLTSSIRVVAIFHTSRDPQDLMGRT